MRTCCGRAFTVSGLKLHKARSLAHRLDPWRRKRYARGAWQHHSAEALRRSLLRAHVEIARLRKVLKLLGASA